MMTDIDMNTSDANETINNTPNTHQSDIEHFLNLNTILLSLVDFIRPETYIAQDELQIYQELKDKVLRTLTSKQNKQEKKIGSTLSSQIADIESIRTTSRIYDFLARHQKGNSTTHNGKLSSNAQVSREELLKKLHDKMPHRQQQKENGVKDKNKRKETRDKPKGNEKRPRVTTKEWVPPSSVDKQNSQPSAEVSSTIPTNITFGRFEFDAEDSVDKTSKKKKFGKTQTKQKQLISTLKKVESEQNELERLQQENPSEGKEALRSKHWQMALAKAKGEKVRDNVQLLRKSIKKQKKIRQRSAKNWQKNKAEVDKRMKERQEKRKENLQKRKDDKKAKIKKRLIKKGRLIS